MKIILLLLIVVSLQAITDATQLTFTKIGGRIYVETDPKHFALYGQVTDKDGVRIITIDEEGQYHQTSDCKRQWTDIKKMNKETLKSYSEIRDNYLKEQRSPAESPESYTWTDNYSSDHREYSVTRLDSGTLVYSSEYFPDKLAKVIISDGVVVFAHYDGTLTMKTMNCLYLNEKILVAGIKKINPNGKKSSIFSSTGDKILKKHLKSNPIDETSFSLEQQYIKTYTKEEMDAMTQAIRGAGFKAFDGH